MEGLGIYWSLIEMLGEADGHKLSRSKIPTIARDLWIDAALLEQIVNFCTNKDIDIFSSKSNKFWSCGLLKRMIRRREISEARASAGRNGGKAKAKQMLSKSEAGKERKGKEIKGEESKEIKAWFSSPDECAEFFVSIGSDREESEKFTNYYESNGRRVGKNPMRDVRAAARNWVKNKKLFHPQPVHVKNSPPRDPPPKPPVIFRASDTKSIGEIASREELEKAFEQLKE